MSNAPLYLKQFVQDVASLPQYEFDNWFKQLTWKGQLQVNNETYFKIYFCGLKHTDGFVSNKNNCSFKIYVECIESDQKVVLFDEEIHGYAPLLVERKDFICEEPVFELYSDDNSNSSFEIFIWTNSSVDFLDEFKFSQSGTIKTLDGQLANLSFLKSNAFDAFGIILKNVNSKYIKLTGIELS